MWEARLFSSAASCAFALTLMGAYHVGQRSISFALSPELTAQLGVSSPIVHGLVWYPVNAGIARSPQLEECGDPLFTSSCGASAAPIAPQPMRLPLIVISHGTGGSAEQMAWLGAALARAGFVAMAISHPGNNLSSATVQGFVYWWLRPRTLSAAIDAILADPTLGAQIDPSRIGAAGFSLGGFSVLGLAGATVDMAQFHAECATTPSACDAPPEMAPLLPQYRAMMKNDPAFHATETTGLHSEPDPRIRAVYAIAPAIGSAVTPESLHHIAIRVRIAYGSDDIDVPPAYNAEFYARSIPGATTLTVPGAAHYTFLDTCTPQDSEQLPNLCTDVAGVSRATVHDQVAADAVSFFQRALLH
jgi:predicted dienelactone hydrolase